MEQWIETAASALLRRRHALMAVWVALTLATLARGAIIQPLDVGAVLLLMFFWGALGFGAMWLLRGWWVVLDTISPKLTRRGWSNIFVVASPVVCALFVVIAPRSNPAASSDPAPAALFIGMGVAAEIIARGKPNEDRDNPR